MELEKILARLEEEGYKVESEKVDNDLYSFHKITGNNILAGYCTPHDGNQINASYSYLNGKISADNDMCFDKWSKCPVAIPLPKDKDQLEYLLKELKYLGTKEGYEKSNSYDYDFVYEYPES